MNNKLYDIVGRKIGALTVLDYDHAGPNSSHHYKCQCECGNIVIRSRGCLRNKHDEHSCGCHKRKNTLKKMVGKNLVD